MRQANMKFRFLQALVLDILQNPMQRQWSVQGFGMLRTYLPDDMRLNIWDHRLTAPNVSTIHTHPWDFQSLVVFGHLQNVRFEVREEGSGLRTYNHAVIKPGPGGGKMVDKGTVGLYSKAVEVYQPGDEYYQRAEEVHQSRPSHGCITINFRTRHEPDEALVYWPANESWVSAEPKPAMPEEVYKAADLVKFLNGASNR